MSENKKKFKKIAFLDRDGIINKKADEHCYITQIDDFIFNEGIFEYLKYLRSQGFELIIITNQRGIARGHFSEESLKKIHDFMLKQFEKYGIKILDIFYCPHEEGTCNCRKPKPGLLEQACKKYVIDLNESMLISDSREDIKMGKKFGIADCVFIDSDSINLLKHQL